MTTIKDLAIRLVCVIGTAAIVLTAIVALATLNR